MKATQLATQKSNRAEHILRKLLPGLIGAAMLAWILGAPARLSALQPTPVQPSHSHTNNPANARSNGPAYLVKDLLPGPPSYNPPSNPASFVTMNGAAYFVAGDELAGRELWRSDGTPAGTSRVKDIFPGANPSSPADLTIAMGPAGETLFFQAIDGSYGYELWKSDGTAAGTVLVKDIRPGPSHSSPHDLVSINGTLFFVADDGVHGYELWASDGTREGTRLVKDINTSEVCAVAPCGSFPSNLTAVGGSAGGAIFFGADDGIHGVELWVSDGTLTGTTLVEDIYPGICSSTQPCSSSPDELTAVGGTVFFNADSAAGRELWRSDGTPAGTYLIKDVHTSLYSVGPGNLSAYNNTLFFTADDGAHGYELWTSDGTATGTLMLQDIYSGTTGSTPAQFTPAGDWLYFTAEDAEHGRELWRSDGTPGGTALFADVNPGPAGSGPQALAVSGARLYFVAQGDDTTGQELWSSAGSPGDASLVADIYPGACMSHLLSHPCSAFFDPEHFDPVQLLPFDAGASTILFRANDGQHGYEPWRSDGTLTGTVIISDIARPYASSYPSHLTALSDTLFFDAPAAGYGYELWRSDGTPTGTLLVADIYSGTASSSPDFLTAAGGTLYFRADDGKHGQELWRSDGTLSGTVMVSDIYTGTCPPGPCSANPTYLAAEGDRVYFSANDGEHGNELWASDGTPTGTIMVADSVPGPTSSAPALLKPVGDLVYFVANDGEHGVELWASNGTLTGTRLVSDITPGTAGTDIAWLTDVSGTLFFRADDGVHGHELWRSDGTPAGTTIISDIVPGPGSPSILNLTPAGARVFFIADDGERGLELWISDGTPTGTHRVADIWPGALDFGSDLTAVPDPSSPTGYALYFRANDGEHGAELWRSDGTPEGTRLVVDRVPGPYGSFPQSVTQVRPDGRIVFAAATDLTGAELWQSDGTPEGTAMVQDIAPGSDSSQPHGFVVAGSHVFFLANDGATGVELWALRPADLGTAGKSYVFLPLLVRMPPAPQDDELSVRESAITLETYNWENGLYTIPGDSIYPYPHLNRDWVTTHAPQTYRTVVLENSLVRVTVLPAIGGRILCWEDKYTGRLLTYANPVIKPAYNWGYRGWWLGTGGVEWAFPVEEHGLNEYRPWQYELLSGDGWRGIREWDLESRTGLTIEVTLRLEANAADLGIAPRIINATGQPQSFMFWINAMLTLSGRNAPSSALRFWLSTSQVQVNSSGDLSLPPPRGLMSWPQYDGRDFSYYSTWLRYLGVFATEATGAAGAYDEAADQGMVRAYPPAIARGVKLFCLGDIGSAQYTDDNSRYFELWGGYNTSFFPEDYATIQPGQEIAWQEHWYPASGIGGLSWADEHLAAAFSVTASGIHAGLYAPRATQARLVLRQNGAVVTQWDVTAGPTAPFRATHPGSGSGWSLEIWQGNTLVAQLP
jgi:ELWxxDGT repeat protein